MRKPSNRWRPGTVKFNGYCPVVDENGREVFMCMSFADAKALCREVNERRMAWQYKISIGLMVIAALIAAWNTVVAL